MKKDPFSLFFDRGVGVYCGNVKETKLHAHHAIEIVFALSGCFKVVDKFGIQEKYQLVLIPNDIQHQFVAINDVTPVFIYLDPFHDIGKALTSRFKLNKEIVGLNVIPNQHIFTNLHLWRSGKDINIFETVAALAHQLTGTGFYTNESDERILKSIENIHADLHMDIRIKDIASKAHLSESRYAHLFKEQVGIPFRRFVLWTRLQTTVKSVIEGNSLTSACYDGGFSDLPHFSKTFFDMFGVPPSSVLKG